MYVKECLLYPTELKTYSRIHSLAHRFSISISPVSVVAFSFSVHLQSSVSLHLPLRCAYIAGNFHLLFLFCTRIVGNENGFRVSL